MTQFHVLLLTARSLHVVSRISGHVVQEMLISSSIPTITPGGFLRLVRDVEAASLFLMAGTHPSCDHQTPKGVMSEPCMS